MNASRMGTRHRLAYSLSLLLWGSLSLACDPKVFERISSTQSAPTEVNNGDQFKLRRASLLAESILESRAFVQKEFELAKSPVSANCSTGQCGQAFAIVATFLRLQGVPLSKMHFLQVGEADGLLKGTAPFHYVLTYEMMDKGIQQIAVSDATLWQFPKVIEKLKLTEAGREIISGLQKEGYWIATEPRLQAYRNAMGGTAQVELSDLTKSNLPYKKSKSEIINDMTDVTLDRFQVKNEDQLIDLLNSVHDGHVNTRTNK